MATPNTLLQSRYLVLNPIESNGFPALTIELFGCWHSDVDSNPAVTVIDGPVEVSTLH